MTKLQLLGVAKVRRSLMVPIILFTVVNAMTRIHTFERQWLWKAPAYVLFDSLLWIGIAFLVFAVVEWRQKLRPQPRFAAMATATAGIAGLATTVITLRALFASILSGRPFVSVLLAYLPGPFFSATFYVAIVTGIAYAVHSWAIDDRRLAEEAELEAAIARAELKAVSARLQPELLDAALARIAAVMATDVTRAQRMISDLGAQLHDSLASAPVRDRRRRPLRSGRIHAAR